MALLLEKVLCIYVLVQIAVLFAVKLEIFCQIIIEKLNVDVITVDVMFFNDYVA